jgi:AraC family transcriptional regulator
MLLTPSELGSGRSEAETVIIHGEPAWRRPRILEHPMPHFHAAASRWVDPITQKHEAFAEAANSRYTIGLALRSTRLAIAVDGNVVHDDLVFPGMLQITMPSQSVRGLFRAPSHFLHLHIGSHFLAKCYEEVSGRTSLSEIVFRNGFCRDTTMEQLGNALVRADTLTHGPDALYADGIFLAIVARLLDLSLRGQLSLNEAKTAALAKWRLKRTIEYVDAHLSDTIRLADLAFVAGFAPMHFAAQFRAATGLRPHEYVLRRRIERSQQLLLDRRNSVSEAALSVGFQTQAHFTAVFKRFCGETPHQWRISRPTQK